MPTHGQTWQEHSRRLGQILDLEAREAAADHGDDNRRAFIEERMTHNFTGTPPATMDDVLAAVRVLTREVRALRDAIEPPASGLILGTAAMAAYNRLKAGC